MLFFTLCRFIWKLVLMQIFPRCCFECEMEWLFLNYIVKKAWRWTNEKIYPFYFQYITCDYWQSGMYMKWNDQTFFLITEKPTNKKCLEVFTPINPAGYKILGCLVDLVDNLLEEWYPGLQLNSSKNGSSVQRLSPCFVCQRHYFQLEDIISESYQSESINCENCGSVLIQAVAPDVVFADIDRELVLEECQISFQDTDSKTLGVGAFAYVYQAQVNGINLALKVTAIFDVFWFYGKLVSLFVFIIHLRNVFCWFTHLSYLT